MSEVMREAYGRHLVELGSGHPELVVLDADVSCSTKSAFFGKAFPDRFFNVGVAEGNLAGVAAGLAMSGYHPVINAFSIFLSLKSLDQIRNDICYNNLPVVIAGGYAGLSDSFDGGSHQAVEDIAIFRALPNMEVIVPADAHQAELALDYAVSRRNPVYIRLNRNVSPDVVTDCDAFMEQRPFRLRSGNDITIVSTGITSSMAFDAAEILEKSGIHADVFCVPFLKPARMESVLESARCTGRLLTVEEHLLVGGLYSAVAEAALEAGFTCRADKIGVNDRFGESGPYTELLEKFGLSAKAIADRAKALI